MGAKSVGSIRWEPVGAGLPGRDENRASITLVCDDYPGASFTIDFDEATGAAVRLDVVTDPQYHPRYWLGGGGQEPPSPRPLTPLTARLVHDLPFGEMVAAARAMLAGWTAELDEHESAADMAARRQHFGAVLRERPGRRGRTDLEYAHLADAYARLVADGDRAPVRTLAVDLSVAESTVRNQVSEARARGLLTSSRPGRAGGRLTARARRLLTEGDDHGAR